MRRREVRETWEMHRVGGEGGMTYSRSGVGKAALTCCRFSIKGMSTRDTTTLSPSMAARITPPTSAFLAATLAPARAANSPPVAAPDRIAFQGSSFLRRYTKLQSKQLNSVPHTAKLPPRMGTRVLTRETAWLSLCPCGALRMPPIVCHTTPPARPKQKAPPASSTTRHGHGSLVWSSLSLPRDMLETSTDTKKKGQPREKRGGSSNLRPAPARQIRLQTAETHQPYDRTLLYVLWQLLCRRRAAHRRKSFDEFSAVSV